MGLVVGSTGVGVGVGVGSGVGTGIVPFEVSFDGIVSLPERLESTHLSACFQDR